MSRLGRGGRARPTLLARVVGGVVLLVLAVALASCGIPMDGGPHSIETTQPPTSSPGAAAQPAPESGSGPKVYFVASDTPQGGERLQPVRRDVDSSPTSVLRALLTGLTDDDQDRRLQTYIPVGTTLVEAGLADGTLTVDLSDAFFDAKGEQQIKAVAQIVYTATGLSQVERVRLLVDGQARDWPRGNGVAVSTPLTAFDYPELNPSSQPDYPPAVGVPQSTSTTVASTATAETTTATAAATPGASPDG
jgi:hypothetical protein